MIKALHVIEPAPNGGAEAVVLGLVRETARRGGQIAVAPISQSAASEAFAAAVTDAGGEVVEVRCGRRRYVKESLAVRDLIVRRHVEVVHTHVYHADFVGYAAARMAKKPVVSTVHGFTQGGLKHRLYQWADAEVLKRFDAVLCVSEALRAYMIARGADAERVYHVPNAHIAAAQLARRDARAELGCDERRIVVGWVGRLSAEKGADLLLKSAAQFPEDWDVVVVGDGPERARLERMALRLPRVRFVGSRVNAARLLRAFDLLVISSRSEGLPMVMLEAMAAHVPIVSFAVGGIPGALGREAAWLVAPTDTEALARAVMRAVQSPDEASRRAHLAHQILETRYAPARWLDEIQAVYARIARFGAQPG